MVRTGSTDPFGVSRVCSIIVESIREICANTMVKHKCRYILYIKLYTHVCVCVSHILCVCVYQTQDECNLVHMQLPLITCY